VKQTKSCTREAAEHRLNFSSREDLQMPVFSKTRSAIVLGTFVMLAGSASFCALVVASPFHARSTAPQDKIQKKSALSKPCTWPGISPHRLQGVVDASDTLPPPLAADAMIRVANKVASACPALTRNLLQHAFDEADGVEPATAYKLATGVGLSTDSRLFFMDRTYALAMDRLSLRSRAVLGMVGVDAPKAIQLFQQIGPPLPPAATCASGFAPDVSIYYDALGKIVGVWKGRKPRTQAEAQAPFQELQEVASATTSPVQLAPLAKVLAEANLAPAELSSLLNTLAAAIANFPVDDDSFYSRKEYPSVKARDQLVQLARTKQISAAAFVRSFHDYLDRSLNGSHCDGNEPKNVKELGSLYQSFARVPGAPEQTSQSLNIPDTAPPIEPRPDAGEYWQTPQGKVLLLDAKHLNFDDNWREFTDADFKRPEWQDRVRHLLDDMDNWNSSDEASAADYYHEVEALIFRVLSRLPPSELYDQVLALWIKTFSESSLQWDNPAEWYIGISDFLRFSRKNIYGPPTAPIDTLKNSSNPYLSSLGVVSEFLQ